MRLVQSSLWLFVMVLATSTLQGAEGVSERGASFKGAGGTVIRGSIILPSHPPATRLPGLVLLAGSGPTDRDGNQLPAIRTDLLRQIAEGLARKGIVTLRFDKRGMNANAGELPEPVRYGEFFRWENFTADAQAALGYLRSQPEVDPSRAGFVGHSEGGMLALVAADAMHDGHARPAVLILLSTPGRPIDAVLNDQLARNLKSQHAFAIQTKFYLAANARIVKTIRQTGQVPADVPAGLAGLYPSYLGKFLQSEFALDPGKLAASYPGPVLVVAGEKDVQVSPTLDAGALDAALKSRHPDDHELFVAPRASHNLKPVTKDEDPGFEGPASAKVMEKITSWAAAKLYAPGGAAR